jgi:hypothetical protein
MRGVRENETIETYLLASPLLLIGINFVEAERPPATGTDPVNERNAPVEKAFPPISMSAQQPPMKINLHLCEQ